jgi:hypothetical protein
MRLIATPLRVAILAVGLALPAQAATPDYPPAFPRAGARELLDNSWGSVWDVIYQPGEPTPMHRHRFDFVGVELADSSVTVTTPDGVAKTFPSKHGESYFLARGTTHVEETPAGSPKRHAVIIDLKDRAPITPSPSAFTDSAAARKVTDNARVTLWDYAWPANPAKPVTLTHNTFIIIVDGGELKGLGPDGKAHVQAASSGQVLFRAAGTRFAEAAAKGPIRAVLVEVK